MPVVAAAGGVQWQHVKLTQQQLQLHHLRCRSTILLVFKDVIFVDLLHFILKSTWINGLSTLRYLSIV
jgi:hypothetical protein